MNLLKDFMPKGLLAAAAILAMTATTACSDDDSETEQTSSVSNDDNGQDSNGEGQNGDNGQSGNTNTAPAHVVAVDLGLSVKWANCNVGASAPEDIGGYYAWGETEEKDSYTWENYKWCNGTDKTITKYCSRDDYGTPDGRPARLEPDDDVAHVKWGGTWRMPTWSEFEELFGCSWGWTTVNGVYGYRITSQTTGNSIFLPSECYYVNGKLINPITQYWSSTGRKNDCGAYYLWMSYAAHAESTMSRCEGSLIRPVAE